MDKSEIVFGILNKLYAQQAERWKSIPDTPNQDSMNEAIADAMNMLETLYVLANLPSEQVKGFIPYGQKDHD